MTYHKPANAPRLLAKSFPRKEDGRVSMTLAGFLTAAYKLANDKARELGWIETRRNPGRSWLITAAIEGTLGGVAIWPADKDQPTNPSACS
jgi:hypothetical protein